MKNTKVQAYLERWNKADDMIEFTVSSATVELAAQALGVAPALIAKSLTFYDSPDSCLMIITAGDAKIDNAEFKKEFGKKARMLTAEDVTRLTGHEIGGVCPFALPDKGVRVF
jgi:prolyl-tRNA editing enzyme YbaK/EbsC (Cys-tRNA(Pro) deacylase)